MPRYLVSVPFSLHVWLEAESDDAISDEDVEDALFIEYGKYAEIDVRNGGGLWEIIDSE